MSYIAARHTTLWLSVNDASVGSSLVTSSHVSCLSRAWTSFRHDNCMPSSLQCDIMWHNVTLWLSANDASVGSSLVTSSCRTCVPLVNGKILGKDIHRCGNNSLFFHYVFCGFWRNVYIDCRNFAGFRHSVALPAVSAGACKCHAR